MPRLAMLTAPLLVALCSLPAAAEDSLPVKTLSALKAATVYVKVKNGALEGAGSGFVIRSHGEEALVVTNEHVVNPKVREEPEGRPPFGTPRIRPPRFPFPMARVDGGGPTTCEVVFNSGRKDEKTAKADVLTTDADVDLAVLKVLGVKDLPPPIDLSPKVDVVETMTIWTLGFPFGTDLSPDRKANPAVTIGKASVTSLRENDKGEVTQIQFEGEINPGNSGGPVVDTQGRLIGVTSAKVRNTRIAMAVPAAEVHKLVDGKPARVTVFTQNIGDRGPEVKAVLTLNDPLGKVRKAAIRFIASDKLKGTLKVGADGNWPPLPDAEVAELKINPGRAEGILKVKLPGGKGKLTIQSVLTLEGDIVRHGPPTQVSVSLD